MEKNVAAAKRCGISGSIRKKCVPESNVKYREQFLLGVVTITTSSSISEERQIRPIWMNTKSSV